MNRHKFPTTPDALYPTHNGGGEYMVDSISSLRWHCDSGANDFAS